MNKRKEYIKSCEVSFVESAVLGGFEQKFAAEGKTKDLPVMLCLHGGPGLPFPFAVGCRGLFPFLTDKFIMVYWDQLGSGINRRKIDDGFTVDDFVNMTVDLVKHLKSRFKDNKLYLFGMSWGSVLALRASNAVPELIDGVTTFGQVLTTPMFSSECWAAVERSSAPKSRKKFVKELLSKDISEVTPKDAYKLSATVRKYTEGYFNRKSKFSMGGLVKGLFTSPDYNIIDAYSVFKNSYKWNRSLSRELMFIDLRDALKNVAVPYHIYQGDTDIVTSTNDVKSFVETCGNPNVTCTVCENTGHMGSEDVIKTIFANYAL